MPSCAAYGCTNRPERDRIKGITFHTFPKKSALRAKWIQAIRRQNYVPSHRAVLCSEHFKEEHIDRTSLSCVRLREGVVPSIFPAFPTHLTSHVKTRKPPATRRDDNDVALLTEASPTISAVESDMQAPAADMFPQRATLKRKLFDHEEKLRISRKRIKLLLQTRRRLQKKKAELSDVVNDLRKKQLLSSNCKRSWKFVLVGFQIC